jgi:predicted phosphodiesterase
MTKTVVCIGDLHGRTSWKDWPKHIPAGKSTNIKDYILVFVGDYVDSYDLTDQEIFSCLLEVIELKKQYPENVVLLLGNHDVGYFSGVKFRCSGYRESMASGLRVIFEQNRHLFQYYYVSGSRLISHAGISMDWVRDAISEVVAKAGPMPYQNSLDGELFSYFMEDVERYMEHLLYSDNGPLWIRPSALASDAFGKYNGMVQVVGHTHMETITTEGSCVFIDCLGSEANFYIFEGI